MGTTLQNAIAELLEEIREVRGDEHAANAAITIMGLWHKATGTPTVNETMGAIIKASYEHLEEHKSKAHVICRRIREQIDSTQFDQYGDAPKDKALSTIESYLNALESESEGG